MNDNEKENLKETAGIGCAFLYIGVQLAIPVLVFLFLCMLLFKGCVRMFN